MSFKPLWNACLKNFMPGIDKLKRLLGPLLIGDTAIISNVDLSSCREVLVSNHPSVPRELWSVKEGRVRVGAGGRLPVTLVVRAVGIVVLEEGDLLAQIVLA